MNTNMSGASMTNITSILAHNISLIENNEIHDISDIFLYQITLYKTIM